MSETVIGELKVSDISTLNKLLGLNDSLVTSGGLGLKLTEESIRALMESGAIGKRLDGNSDNCSNPLETANGLKSDSNNSTKGSRAKRKDKPRQENTSTDKFFSAGEKKHKHTRQRRTAAPKDDPDHSKEQIRQQEKIPLKNKARTKSCQISPASRSSEDSTQPSPSKVSTNINTVEICSEPKLQTTKSMSSSPRDIFNTNKLNDMCSASDSEKNEVETLNKSRHTRSHRSNYRGNDLKASSESESAGKSPKSKRLKKNVEIPNSDPDVTDNGAESKITRTKTLPVKLSNSEASFGENVLLPTRTSRSKTIKSASSCPNAFRVRIESTLRSYGFDPGFISQNADVEALRHLWERAGPGARLVVISKQGLRNSKPYYSIAIVNDQPD